MSILSTFRVTKVHVKVGRWSKRAKLCPRSHWMSPLRPIRFVSLALPWHVVLSIIPDVKRIITQSFFFIYDKNSGVLELILWFYEFLVFTSFHSWSVQLLESALCRQISLPVAHQLWIYRDANNGSLKNWNHATFQPMLSIYYWKQMTSEFWVTF